jgi:hypothetical protein
LKLRKGYQSNPETVKAGLKAKNAIEILLSNFLKKHYPSLCDAVTKDQIEEQLRLVQIARPLIIQYL